ncbi:hypothetical protein THOM_3179 [Trachipleistophora hominis]|uniref:Uncharacterized protein n=1 Tax=Trachipleistophora hominis TaxID=72359 RepID=L7JS77_TRAHO|nr:hypothetical protein THOM_3179 [Trachipleistophora hominis]
MHNINFSFVYSSLNPKPFIEQPLNNKKVPPEKKQILMTTRKQERNLEHREYRNNNYPRDEHYRARYASTRRPMYSAMRESARARYLPEGDGGRYEERSFRRRYDDRPYDRPRDRLYDRRERVYDRYGSRGSFRRGGSRERIPTVEVMDAQMKRYMAGEKIEAGYEKE